MKIFGRSQSSDSSPLRLTDDGIRLGTRLKACLKDSHRTLLFTGAGERDGVTTAATQVALALAQMNEGEVLLVDAALRRSSLHKVFGVEQAPGLTDVIVRKATLEKAIHVSEFPGLSVLASGSSGLDPAALLTCSAYVELLEEVRRLFAFIIFDSSPIVDFSDTALIAPRMDGVVIIAAAGRRTRSDIREVKQLLDGLRVNVLGVVLSQ